MKCRFVPFFLVLLLIAGSGFAQAWEKYVAPDGSFSFVYPEGWTVSNNESIIQVGDEATDQELVVVAIPYDHFSRTLAMPENPYEPWHLE